MRKLHQYLLAPGIVLYFAGRLISRSYPTIGTILIVIGCLLLLSEIIYMLIHYKEYRDQLKTIGLIVIVFIIIIAIIHYFFR